MANSKADGVERIWARLKALRPLWLLIFLGIAVHVLLSQFAQLSHLNEVIRGAAWGAVSAAVVAQVFSYLSSGFALSTLVRIFNQNLSTLRGVLITLAANSLGLLGGGWVTTGAATFQWVHEFGVEAEAAGLASSIPLFLNNVALVMGALIGLTYLLFMRQLSAVQIIAFGIVLAGMLLIAGAGFWAASHRKRVLQIAQNWNGWMASRWNLRISTRRLQTRFEDFFADWEAMFRGRLLLPVIGAFGNVAFDAITLDFLFVALGAPVSLGVLLAGYGLPLLLAKVAFIFPGGVGVIESSMVALFASLGVPGEKAIIAVLAYRIFSFWTPVLLGFPAIVWVRKIVAEKSANPQ